MTKTPIEALQDFDFTVNTHKDATTIKYDPNAPLIRAKTNYAKDKYNESSKKEKQRLRSRIVSLKRNDELVSFVGEVIPTPIKEKKGNKKNEI